MSRKIKDIPISPLLEKPALKPCPFCGGKAVIVVNYSEILPTHRVKCVVCNAQMGTHHVCYDGRGARFFQNEEEAINAWNRRVTE